MPQFQKFAAFLETLLNILCYLLFSLTINFINIFYKFQYTHIYNTFKKNYYKNVSIRKPFINHVCDVERSRE